MRVLVGVLVLVVLMQSCSQSKLSQDLGCKEVDFSNLEVIEDVHQKFSVQLPKNWNTNLYYDNNQSSIYAADTTKQLTDTYLVDITMITDNIEFDTDFFFEHKNQLNQSNLVETSSFETPFLEKEAYYSRALGTKRGFPYQVINVFVRNDKNSYILAKVDVYGDSSSNERLCKAVHLLEKIKLND